MKKLLICVFLLKTVGCDAGSSSLLVQEGAPENATETTQGIFPPATTWEEKFKLAIGVLEWMIPHCGLSFTGDQDRCDAPAFAGCYQEPQFETVGECVQWCVNGSED